MIVITGATGQLGSQIVDRLLDRVPRRGRGRERARRRQGRRPRRARCAGPRRRLHRPGHAGARLRGRRPGARRLRRHPRPRRGRGEHRRHRRRPRRGSQPHPLHQPPGRLAGTRSSPPQPTHAATEEHLAALGVPFTALRNGFYASTLELLHRRRAARPAQLVAPADGPVSWTAHADLAEAAAVALDRGRRARRRHRTADRLGDARPRSGGRHPQRHHGPHRRTGRRRRRRVAGGRHRSEACPRRRPTSPSACTARRDEGEFAVTDPTLEAVIGRRPTSVRSVLEAIVAQR